MRLLMIRHAEPDYEIDSLTEKGWREALYLAERLEYTDIDKCYVSTLGRARDTASLTLARKKMQAEECEWLKEFPTQIVRPDRGYKTTTWDFLPQDWKHVREYYDKDIWASTDLMKEGEVLQE